MTDLTYIPTGEDWLYLAGHKDLFMGEIVGYAMGDRMTKQLVMQSLQRALSIKRPGSGLIHHKDITEYIDIFYNRQRKQARLGYLSPVAFERRFYENQLTEVKSFVSTIDDRYHLVSTTKKLTL